MERRATDDLHEQIGIISLVLITVTALLVAATIIFPAIAIVTAPIIKFIAEIGVILAFIDILLCSYDMATEGDYNEAWLESMNRALFDLIGLGFFHIDMRSFFSIDELNKIVDAIIKFASNIVDEAKKYI